MTDSNRSFRCRRTKDSTQQRRSLDISLSLSFSLSFSLSLIISDSLWLSLSLSLSLSVSLSLSLSLHLSLSLSLSPSLSLSLRQSTCVCHVILVSYGMALSGSSLSAFRRSDEGLAQMCKSHDLNMSRRYIVRQYFPILSQGSTVGLPEN